MEPAFPVSPALQTNSLPAEPVGNAMILKGLKIFFFFFGVRMIFFFLVKIADLRKELSYSDKKRFPTCYWVCVCMSGVGSEVGNLFHHFPLI